MLPCQYQDNESNCVGRAHNILPWQYLDNGTILYRKGTQYAILVVS